jgi:hypothetical protein
MVLPVLVHISSYRRRDMKNFEHNYTGFRLHEQTFSSKFHIPGPGAGWGAGDVILTSCESASCKSIGVLDTQEQLAAGFKLKAFFHTCGEHSPHPVFPGA